MRSVFVLMAIASAVSAAARGPTEPPQIPLCMIGDSITWAGDGDLWRQYLLEEIPTLAFVGTHSARLGYAHAGEGGNSTHAVLARLDDLPDCPNYHLMIGINDSAAAKNAEEVDAVAAGTAERIIAIVGRLLDRPSCERVFLASILAAQHTNEFRDAAGSRTNELLRPELAPGGALADERIVWVEYERPVRAMEGWRAIMPVHPRPEGYRIIAGILADALRAEMGLPEEIAAPVPAPGSSVRVVNLWQAGADGQTAVPIIAGWYTLSFDVREVAAEGGSVTLRSVEDVDKPLEQSFALAPGCGGQRLSFELFTQYEGYQYRRSHLALEVAGATIERILLEKLRPSRQASVHGEGSYLDTQTPPALGELVELP